MLNLQNQDAERAPRVRAHTSQSRHDNFGSECAKKNSTQLGGLNPARNLHLVAWSRRWVQIQEEQ
jgi:hypothetical protein